MLRSIFAFGFVLLCGSGMEITMKIILSILFSLSLMLCIGSGASADAKDLQKEIYVSAAGNDEKNDGSLARPFKSIERARNEIREIKGKSGLPNGGITVFIRGGNYEYPKSGLKFTYDDSGTKQAPITYRAYRNEKVSVIGGIRLDIKNFRKVTDEKLLLRIYDEKARGNIFECNLSKYAKDYDIGGSGYVEIEKTGRNVQNQLICDDKQMVLSEFPNRVNGEPSWVNIYEDVENGKSFRLAPELSDRVNNWKKSDWGKMTVYGPVGTEWLTANSHITSIQDGLIVIDHSGGKSQGGKSPLRIRNCFPELDAPGEYFIDEDTKILYFYPPKNVDKNSEIYLSTIGEPLIDCRASFVTFRGLTLNGTRTVGINFRDCTDCKVLFCNIYNTQDSAVKAGNDWKVDPIRRLTVYGNYFRDVNNCVFTAGGSRVKFEKSGTKIWNNECENFASVNASVDARASVVLYCSAIRTCGIGHDVAYNKIHGSDHLAIQQHGCFNTFRFNEIYDVCRTTADMGVFYCINSMSASGVRIENNYVHDIKLYPSFKGNWYGLKGIYWDDNTCFGTFKNNLFANLEGSGVWNNGGSYATLSNNVGYNLKYQTANADGGPLGAGSVISEMAKTKRAQDDWNGYLNSKKEWEGWENRLRELNPDYFKVIGGDIGIPTGDTVTNNISVNAGLSTASDSCEDLIFEGNIEMKAEDLFVNAQNGDFRIKTDSAVYKESPGFKDIEFEKMGLLSEKAFARVKDSIVLTIDNGGAMVNGEFKMIDSANDDIVPFIDNSRTLVPLRFVSEALKAKVDWDGETRTAILTSGEKTIKVQINSSIMLAGGKAVELDCPAKIIEGRTMVPIRAISESFKKKVFWDPKGLIVIGDNDKPFSSGDEYDGYLIDFLISYVDIGK